MGNGPGRLNLGRLRHSASASARWVAKNTRGDIRKEIGDALHLFVAHTIKVELYAMCSKLKTSASKYGAVKTLRLLCQPVLNGRLLGHTLK